jgi:hypothetical protein
MLPGSDDELPGHAKQAATVVAVVPSKYLPAGQLVQGMEPAESLNLPSGHPVHL